ERDNRDEEQVTGGKNGGESDREGINVLIRRREKNDKADEGKRYKKDSPASVPAKKRCRRAVFVGRGLMQSDCPDDLIEDPERGCENDRFCRQAGAINRWQ